MIKYFFVFMIFLFAIGCTKYYKVTDPSTERIYYTKDIDDKGSGAIKLEDERTGNTVTLQSSEIEEITEDQFNFGVISE